jgi:hypothetical protein
VKRHLGVALALMLGLSLILAACGGAPATEESAAPEQPDAAPAATDTPVPQPTATTDTGYDTFTAWSGGWSGSWTNTTFGSTGPIEAEVVFNPDGTASFTFDAGGFVFGAIDPPAVTFDATYDAMGVTIDMPGDAIFGDVTVTMHPDGTFEMAGDVIPTTGIARVEAAGTFTETSAEGTYTVFFDGEGVAEGTFTMTKAP